MLLYRKPDLELKGRPGTQDDDVIREVMERNCYQAGFFHSWDTIIDVGAHIGVFSVMCMLRGAGRVIAFEPDRENHRYLRANLERWPKAEAHRGAVWSSDERQLYYSGYPDKYTAVGTVLSGCVLNGVGSRREPVPSISLDEVIDLSGEEKIRLLKIDAEGAEYPVLMTAKKLDRVEEIVGEAHELAGKPNELFDHLAQQGFAMDTRRVHRLLWLFWAKRR